MNLRFILLRWLCVLTVCGAASASLAVADDQQISPDQLKFFEAKIRPVLVKECYSCHSNKTGNAKGGLRLDSAQLMHLGGSSGPAVVPGDLDASLIYNAITYQDFSMPPNRRLPQNVIEDFRQWIKMGAPDPRQTEIAKLNSKITNADINQAKAKFWAYQKPKSQVPPQVSDEGWVRGDIDRFVIAGLDQASLRPAADAESYTVLRRLSYDLIGLPPTLEQKATFERAWQRNSDTAIAEIVDQLLEMPQYGERWGRYWLDVARYAESNGREINATFPHAWRYRDYVIDSFNEDKPYDRFLQEQIAGDLLPAKTDQQWSKNLIATTFLAIGPKALSEQNGAQFAADLADEQLDTTTRVILGTSVACARCHDHKFDAIPQTDYYAMLGIFTSTATHFGSPASEFGNVGGVQNRNTSNLIQLPVADPNSFDKSYTTAELAAMTQQMKDLRQELVEARTAMRNNSSGPQNSIQNLLRTQTQMQLLSSLLGSVDKNGKPITFCMGVQDRKAPRDANVLVRGEIDQPAQVVRRDFPQVISDRPAKIASQSSGRLELARWISSKENPLAARVMVNRIWQHLLGRGIVVSTEDFGSTGQPPTHPELLDHLAVQFMQSNWSVKSIVRTIATSRTYRMSSEFEQTKFNQDPDNKLLWRANPRRLDAEAIRDSILIAAGQLELKRPRASEVAKVGYMQVRDGNLINIAQFAMMSGGGDMQGRGMYDRFRRPAGGGQFGGGQPLRGGMSATSERIDMVDATYRSVYMPILRDELPRALEVFDFAEPSMVIGARESSNTPNQALFMMNNEFVLKQSEAFARKVMERSESTSERIEQAFLLAYGRLPTAAQREAVFDFVDAYGRDNRSQNQALMIMAGLCQSLFASADFRYVD